MVKHIALCMLCMATRDKSQLSATCAVHRSHICSHYNWNEFTVQRWMGMATYGAVHTHSVDDWGTAYNCAVCLLSTL